MICPALASAVDLGGFNCPVSRYATSHVFWDACQVSNFLPNRLWSHYSTSNTDTVFYKEFLERLGADCESGRNTTPDGVKQGMIRLSYVR